MNDDQIVGKHVDPNQKDYKPTFSDEVRTIIYVLTAVAGIVGAGFSVFGDPQIGAFISAAAGIVASSFGVVYNPMRMSLK